MKTLNKNITKQFFNTDSGFEDVQATWSSLVESKTPRDAADHLLYAIIRGKDFRKAFAPLSGNTEKGKVRLKTRLDNGQTVDQGLRLAMTDLKSRFQTEENATKTIRRLFGDSVNPLAVRTFIRFLPKLQMKASNSDLLNAEPYSITAPAPTEAAVA